jgi:AAA15 family ATPase/GTPase
MQLTYLHIHNFKSIRDMEITDIDSALILVGKNNTGKTSVLDAICAVCGYSRNLILTKSFRPSALKHQFPLTKKI